MIRRHLLLLVLPALLASLAASGCRCSKSEQAEVEPAADAGPAPWPPPLGAVPNVTVEEAEALRVVRTDRPLGDNPYAEQWKAAPYVKVPLLPQQMAMPKIDEAAVSELTVQGLTDGQRIAWRVAWKDATPDGNVDTGRFCDAVAVQFPVDEDAAPFMGHAEARVHILHWKALWQKDRDVHFQDVEDLHPNTWSDLYWFAEGEAPFRVPGAFQKPESLKWFVALSAGNPMATFSRTAPVEELLAEGWGSLTPHTESATEGKGAWVDGRWAVVFLRPLKTDDPLDTQLEPGKESQIAFAVWDGAAGQVGGRKQWAGWVDFEVAP